MSSYTENYNLNQWEASDQVRRVDFNADNAKIDAALTNLSAQVAAKASQSALNSEISARTSLAAQVAKLGNCQIYHTTYSGDGEMTKTLTFPKKPLLVIIIGNGGSLSHYVPGMPYMMSSAAAAYGTHSEVTWSGTSMTWTIRNDQAKEYAGNWNGWSYQVIALMDAAA